MSIFLQSLTEGAGMHGAPVYEGTIEAGEIGALHVTASAMKDASRITESVSALDAANYAIVTEGYQTIVTEEASKSIFQRIKDFLKKLWGKVTAWFKKTMDRLNSVFMNGEKFVEKYEKEILAVDPKGFKYTGFIYNTDGFQKAINTQINNHESAVNKAVKKYEELAKESPENGQEITQSSAYIEENYYRAFSHDNEGEIKEHLKSVLRNDEAEEIEDMKGTSARDMIVFVRNRKKIEKAVTDFRKKTEKSISDTLKTVERAEKDAISRANKADNDNDRKQAQRASTALSIANQIVSHGSTAIVNLSSLFIESVGEVVRAYTSVLKRLYRHTAVTEGYGYNFGESVTESTDAFSTIFKSL